MDIAIVGGSVAGAYAAIQLGASGHQITVLDHRAPWEKPCGGCVQADALQRFPLLRELPCVWYYPPRLRLLSSFGEKSLTFAPGAGWGMLSRRDLNQALLEKAASAANVRFLRERVNRVARERAGWRVQTASGQVLQADLLIGADGVTSLVRRTLLGSLPREHLGLTVGYLLQRSGQDEAVIKTFADMPGYLWYFPRAQHVSVGIGSRLIQSSARDLWQRLDAFVADYCPRARKESRWGALIPFVSASDFWDGPCAGENWAVIGDAAGHVHPLSEAGLYYALYSADLAAQAILQGDIRRYDGAWREAYGQPLRQATQIFERAGDNCRYLERVVQEAMGASSAAAPWPQPLPVRLSGDEPLAQLRREVYAHVSAIQTLNDYPTLRAWLTEWLEARFRPWGEFALLCRRLAGDFSLDYLARVLSAWLILFGVSGPLDDYADEDKTGDGPWEQLGWKRGNFVALALMAEATGSLLAEPEAPELARAARVLLRRLEESARGQALDIAQVQTLEAYEQMLELKAATLTAALTESVAELAGLEAGPKQALVSFGQELGMALQIVNDYLGVWRQEIVAKPQGGDLAQPQLTYPMFYALLMPHTHRDEFRVLLERPPRERDTGRMLEILNAIGAPKFMRAAIELRKRRALQAVGEVSPECVSDVEIWCNRILLGEGHQDVD